VHIVLNQQTTTGGQFTVTAMAITLLGGAETVDLGVSSCQVTNQIP
jgi:hypothetical protein